MTTMTQPLHNGKNQVIVDHTHDHAVSTGRSESPSKPPKITPVGVQAEIVLVQLISVRALGELPFYLLLVILGHVDWEGMPGAGKPGEIFNTFRAAEVGRWDSASP